MSSVRRLTWRGGPRTGHTSSHSTCKLLILDATDRPSHNVDRYIAEATVRPRVGPDAWLHHCYTAGGHRRRRLSLHLDGRRPMYHIPHNNDIGRRAPTNWCLPPVAIDIYGMMFLVCYIQHSPTNPRYRCYSCRHFRPPEKHRLKPFQATDVIQKRGAKLYQWPLRAEAETRLHQIAIATFPYFHVFWRRFVISLYLRNCDKNFVDTCTVSLKWLIKIAVGRLPSNSYLQRLHFWSTYNVYKRIITRSTSIICSTVAKLKMRSNRQQISREMTDTRDHFCAYLVWFNVESYSEMRKYIPIDCSIKQECLLIEGVPSPTQIFSYAHISRFCSCDLDLDPMTLIYEFDLDIFRCGG